MSFLDDLATLFAAQPPPAPTQIPPPVEPPPPLAAPTPSPTDGIVVAPPSASPGNAAAGARFSAPPLATSPNVPFAGVPIGGAPINVGGARNFDMPGAPPGISVTSPGLTTGVPGNGPATGLAADLARVFGNNGMPAIGRGIPAPTIQPAPVTPPPAVAARPPATTAPTAPPAPGSEPFLNGAFGNNVSTNDVRAFVRTLARGMAAADPRQPALTAFGQGLAGSTVGSYNEQRQLASDKRTTEKEQFDQRMRGNADTRAERADVRAAETSRLANTRVVQEIMRNASGTLNQADRLKLEQLINQRARALNPNGTLTADQLKPQLDAYRQELERQMGARRGATTTPAPTNAPAPTSGPAPTSTAAPVPVNSRADIEALTPGTQFTFNGETYERH